MLCPLLEAVDLRHNSELVPAAMLKGNFGILGEAYLYILGVSSQSGQNDKAES